MKHPNNRTAVCILCHCENTAYCNPDEDDLRCCLWDGLVLPEFYDRVWCDWGINDPLFRFRDDCPYLLEHTLNGTMTTTVSAPQYHEEWAALGKTVPVKRD